MCAVHIWLKRIGVPSARIQSGVWMAIFHSEEPRISLPSDTSGGEIPRRDDAKRHRDAAGPVSGIRRNEGASIKNGGGTRQCTPDGRQAVGAD